MSTLLVAALVTARLLAMPPTATVPAADEISVVALANDLKPLSGVTVTLHRALTPSGTPSPERPVYRVTDDTGHARFASPPAGRYILRFTISGFLTTTIGPFQVCAPSDPCCPMLESPLRIVLSQGPCTSSSQAIP